MREHMNKIFKVIYSKTRHCYVVVSELAKSHCKTAGSHTTRNKTALTAAVLLALGTFSVASVFMPMTAEAADKTKTDGSNFVGVERTDGLLDDSKYANYGGKGAGGADSITLGLNAQAGAGTITIGDQIPIVPLMIRRLQPFWVVLMTPLNLAKP